MAALKWASVMVLFITETSTPYRIDTVGCACAAALSMVAIYLTARDVAACPRVREAATIFRLGVRVGRMRRR